MKSTIKIKPKNLDAGGIAVKKFLAKIQKLLEISRKKWLKSGQKLAKCRTKIGKM